MYAQEGYDLMGAAFEVYNEKGYGMAEEVYQQCLEVELELRGIPFVAKPELELEYKGRRLETKYKPDLMVFGAVVAELKAVSELTSDHEAQLFNYLRIAGQPVGYLINYGCKGKLEFRRFVISDLHRKGKKEDGGTLIFANLR